jgi:hypothetical protein
MTSEASVETTASRTSATLPRPIQVAGTGAWRDWTIRSTTETPSESARSESSSR